MDILKFYAERGPKGKGTYRRRTATPRAEHPDFARKRETLFRKEKGDKWRIRFQQKTETGYSKDSVKDYFTLSGGYGLGGIGNKRIRIRGFKSTTEAYTLLHAKKVRGKRRITKYRR